VVAALLAIYVIAYQPPAGYAEPGPIRALALGLVLMLAASGVVQLAGIAASRRSTYVIVDLAIALGLLWLFAFDPVEHLFYLVVGVVIEAALLVGLSTALFAWAALAAGYTLREVVAYNLLDVPSEPAGVLLRLAMTFGLALIVGSLVEAGRATKAYSSEKEESERLRDIDEMKTAFLAAVSHDLKNPLTAILGFSTTLERRLDRLDRERVLEFLGHISRNGRRLQKMLDDLLDMDRISRGILQPNLAPTDMPALVRNIVEELDLDGRRLKMDAEEVTASVDPPKVERIVENLVTNAVKYTPPATPIGLRIESQNGGVMIAVEDEGPGISDDMKQKVFEPFQRGVGAPNRATGSGVGLSLVARFAELHGGRAWVEDRPGGGASFRVFLPGAGPATSAS